MPQNTFRFAPLVAVTLSLFLVMQTINAIKENTVIGESATPSNVISVSGEGSAYAVPDIATFSFGADATGKTVDDAQKQVTAVVSAALAKVKSDGVADADIQTTDFSANPKYEYNQVICPQAAPAGGPAIVCPPSRQTLVGYEVNETITVKVRKVDSAGTILGDIGGTGVTNVSGLSFTVDDPSKVEADARTKAITDAKNKANELARELGVRLVRMVSFSENGANPMPVYFKADAMSAGVGAPQAVNVQTGQNKVTSDVTITYEIR